jgi:hypothetical protein
VVIASQDPLSIPRSVIELSSTLILHRFTSPLWLKHLKGAVSSLESVGDQDVAVLRPGEALVWAQRCTDPRFTESPQKVWMRARVTNTAARRWSREGRADMGRASKGGRKKKLWDIKATVRALDRILGEEEDPGEKDPDRSFLHFVRALCRNLEANLPAITAFDHLLRLMREKAGPIRRYAHDVNDAFAVYRPLAPVMNELLKEGEADELWKLWFFACEMPKRLRAATAAVDRLLYAAEEYMPAPFNVPGFQVATARAAVILGLRSRGYDVDRMASLLDPAGHRQDARAARDRIRKEVRRLEVMIAGSGSSGGSPRAEVSGLLEEGAAGDSRDEGDPAPKAGKGTADA